MQISTGLKSSMEKCLAPEVINRSSVERENFLPY